MIPPPPPFVHELPAGTQLVAGLGLSTVLPDMDFETGSEAGYVWDAATNKFTCLPNAPQQRKGLFVVGAAVYAAHPTTHVLSLAYNLKDGTGEHLWRPGDPLPVRLFAHFAAGGVIEAWNSGFEYWIWNLVCVPKYGFPPLPVRQLRCAMAKARANAFPGALENASDVMRLSIRKDADGKRLLNKFSVPRNPTKADPRKWITPADDPQDAARLYGYNITDIRAEAEASSRCPDLNPFEQDFWFHDQEINIRGCAVDAAGVADAIAIVEQCFELYNAELRAITGGAVEQASQLERLKAWLATQGYQVGSLDEEHIEALLGNGPGSVTKGTLAHKALQIRAAIGSASIKKLFAIRNQKTMANRLHDLFSYHAARTGRATGNGPQPQNLPKGGPAVFQCGNEACKHWFGAHTHICPWCFTIHPPKKAKEWSAAVHDDAFAVLASRNLRFVEYVFGDAMWLVSGCLRGLFVAAPGHDLIASDFSAIEAVVLAALAGEEWRLDVFRSGKDIYYASAAKITGNTYEFYTDWREANKSPDGKGGWNKPHHPDRQPFGKVAELSSGYGGWVGAWLAFGADEFFTEQEIKRHILAWREASPAIVEFWGGQFRGMPWDERDGRPYYAERYGLEGAAINAVQYPGQWFTVKANHACSRPISYICWNNILYCRLPSGRHLTYHNPQLHAGYQGPHANGSLSHQFLSLSYEGWNTNPKMGAQGWVRMDTYGGKLAENVVQAVARDILANSIINVERAGYPVVLHVHDEIVAEIAKGVGSIEHYEAVMSVLPDFANDNQGEAWPLKVAGGWRGWRYRKD